MLRSRSGPVPHVGLRGEAGGLHQAVVSPEAPPSGTECPGGTTPVEDCRTGLKAPPNSAKHPGVPHQWFPFWNLHPPKAEFLCSRGMTSALQKSGLLPLVGGTSICLEGWVEKNACVHRTTCMHIKPMRVGAITHAGLPTWLSQLANQEAIHVHCELRV
jgi:hypothetical protein